jgi:hypothetical protein
VLQHRADQRRHVVDMHVIALLLALPEQRDRFALGGKPSEAIRAVAVMGVFRSVNQGRPQDRQRQLERRAQHDLAREMHCPVQARRLLARPLHHRIGVVGIDRIGADIYELRHRLSGERSAYGLCHTQVVDQHGIIARRGERRHEYHAVVRPQQALQRRRRLGLEQIELLSCERQHRNFVGGQLVTDRAADESAGADDYDAAWGFADRVQMLKHGDIPSHDEEVPPG